ncbi:transmembrane protein 62 isoform X3 [Myotis myotis]|uniref:transmembrane protein 62 isoform X3 n=1 Tax=Myotis myotis TaxID=51298 RepID=UPI00174E06C3|nr:transmembrane protein 62 isoform X3 [Myotis myotis]
MALGVSVCLSSPPLLSQTKPRAAGGREGPVPGKAQVPAAAFQSGAVGSGPSPEGRPGPLPRGRAGPGGRYGCGAGLPGAGGPGGRGADGRAPGALRPGRPDLAAAPAPRPQEAAPCTGPRSQQYLLGSAGDLTDAKTKDLLGSMQQKVEWQTYHSILKKTRVMEKTKWLDVKGNHDSFNVPSLESVENYYRKYSAIRTDGSFHYVHSTPFGNYSFISLDATLNPGPKRPYNFFGILDEKQMEELLLLSKESNQSNHTIWFGHYTTFTILSPSPGVQSIMSSAIAYLCGHLHTLGGLMPVLHTRHYQGTLELEVGDWKNNRRYRIFAFDHDLFSFSDLIFGEWPVILITNPKSLLYSSKHEPLERLLHSTHIRVLAFSSSSITSVTVKIDGVHLGEATHLSGPIFTLKWNPRNYINSTHNIEVIVQDSAGRSKSVHHIFSLEEDNQLRFDPLASFILLTDYCMVARVLFALIVLIQLFILIIYRHQRYLELKGPWFIGEITKGKMGCCFSFGIFVDGRFLQGSLTFVVGILQLAFFNIPLMAYLCWSLLQRCYGHNFRSHLRQGKYLKIIPVYLFVLLLYIWQIYACYFLQRAYGTLAFFFSPLRTWLTLLTPVLIHRVWTLNSKELVTFTVQLKSHLSS